MLIDNKPESASQDYPYPTLTAYEQALSSQLYSTDSPEGRAYRADVNAKLQASPHLMPGPSEERKRQYWLSKDNGGAQ